MNTGLILYIYICLKIIPTVLALYFSELFVFPIPDLNTIDIYLTQQHVKQVAACLLFDLISAAGDLVNVTSSYWFLNLISMFVWEMQCRFHCTCKLKL
jgi:hypothetical protein